VSFYILDTDHASLLQRNHPSVVRRVLATPEENLALTIVTAEEQLRGWLNSIHRASGDRLILAYARLHGALDYFRTVQIVDFSPAALAQFEELRRQKVRIGTKDLRIAAITLSRNNILVTRNAKDFSRVPGLVFEDWSRD
jgi:tRNA(fMet)-specific endonuclease VapC